LRAAAHAARRSTVADLYCHLVKPSEADGGADVIVARLASQQEVLEVLRLQDKNSLLLFPGALAATSVPAGNLVRSNGVVSDVVTVDEACVVTDVTLDSGLRRLPRAALRDILAVHLGSRDFLFALQPKMLLNMLLFRGLVAPSADPFLMPVPVDVTKMIGNVRGALGPAMAGVTEWERETIELVIGLRGMAEARDFTHRLTVRDLQRVTRGV